MVVVAKPDDHPTRAAKQDDPKSLLLDDLKSLHLGDLISLVVS